MCVHLILGKPKALSYQVGYKYKDSELVLKVEIHRLW